MSFSSSVWMQALSQVGLDVTVRTRRRCYRPAREIPESNVLPCCDLGSVSPIKPLRERLTWLTWCSKTGSTDGCYISERRSSLECLVTWNSHGNGHMGKGNSAMEILWPICCLHREGIWLTAGYRSSIRVQIFADIRTKMKDGNDCS